MNLYRKIAYNTILQIISKALIMFIGVLSVAILTRYLGKFGFGQYTTIITFLSFFGIFADMGLTLVTAQMINRVNINRDKILSNLLSLRLISATLFLGLAPIVALFLPYDAQIKQGILISFSSFIFIALNQVFVGLFQTELKMDRVSIAEISGRIVFLLGLFFTAKLNLGLQGAMVTTVSGSFVNFLLLFLFSKKFCKLKINIDFDIWKEILKKSWPIALTIFFNLIYLKADILILSLIKTQEDVGIYGATYKVIDVLTTLPFMFAGVILPIMNSSLSKNNKQNFKIILQKSINFMAIIAMPIIFGAQFLSKNIMVLVAGPEFSASGNILKILILALGMIFLGCMSSHAIIALDKQKKIIGAYIFTSITALTGYLIFIPKFSYFGAAWVTVFSETVIAFAAFYYVWKYSSFVPRVNIVLKAVLASLVMSLFLYLLPKKIHEIRFSLAYILIFASAVYFISLYLLKGITKKDFQLLKLKK